MGCSRKEKGGEERDGKYYAHAPAQRRAASARNLGFDGSGGAWPLPGHLGTSPGAGRPRDPNSAVGKLGSLSDFQAMGDTGAWRLLAGMVHKRGLLPTW